jgi:hypothetical protein
MMKPVSTITTRATTTRRLADSSKLTRLCRAPSLRLGVRHPLWRYPVGLEKGDDGVFVRRLELAEQFPFERIGHKPDAFYLLVALQLGDLATKLGSSVSSHPIVSS